MPQSLIKFGPTQKNQSNATLLGILTRRKAASVTQLPKSNWPGKSAPSFAVNRLKLIKNTDQQSRTRETKSKIKSKTQSVKLSCRIPVAKIGSGSLSIQPNSRSKTILMNSTWKTNWTASSQLWNKQKPEIRSVKKIMPNLQGEEFERTETDSKSNNSHEAVAFKNNRLNTAFNNTKNRRGNAVSQQLMQQSNKEISQIKSHLLRVHQMQRQSNIQNHAHKDPLGKYVIDYSTFNYVQKILDNPEKWKNYVKRRVNPDSQDYKSDSQFLTGIK